jgi:hypothetical protein
MANMNDSRNPMSREAVFGAIDTEREYQVKRWGYRQPDGSMVEASKDVCDYLVYIKAYLDNAFQAASKNPGNHAALAELRKVATLCVACFEQNGVPIRFSPDTVNARDGEAA